MGERGAAPTGRRWLVPAAVIALDVVLVVTMAVTDTLNLWGWAVLGWLNLFAWAVAGLRRRAMLACFLVAFFLVLMTMDTFERFFGYGPVSMSPEAYPTVVRIVLWGLAGLATGYLGWSALRTLISRARVIHTRAPSRATAPGSGAEQATPDSTSLPRRAARTRRRWPSRLTVQRASLLVFYVSLPLAMVGAGRLVRQIGVSSYTETNTQDFIAAQEGALNTLTSYSAQFAKVAFLVYLATLPTFRLARLPMVLWVMYSGLGIAVGRRRDLAVLVLFFVWYGLTRSRQAADDRWVTKKRLLWGAVATTAMLFVFAALERLRGLGEARGSGLDAIASFLYGQGVTVRVLENVVLHRHLIPDQNYLSEFARTGFLARLLGLPVLQGNSLDRALHGGSLSHSLSLIVLGPKQYLAGISTGTSFIAEGYVQFGLAGVVLVALVYGALLRSIDGLNLSSPLALNIIRVLIAQSVLWAPRGSSTGLLGMLVAPSTIATVIGVVAVGWAMTRWKIGEKLDNRMTRALGFPPAVPAVEKARGPLVSADELSR